ncbi:15669_t:CDS:1, partial [Acaulospora morrowiae]
NGEGAYLWFINETKIDKEKYLNLKSLENWNPDDDKLTVVTSNNAGSEDFAATSNRKKSDGHGKRLDDVETDDVETDDEIKDVQGDYKGFDYYKKSKDARWRGALKLHWKLPANVRNIIQEERGGSTSSKNS